MAKKKTAKPTPKRSYHLRNREGLRLSTLSNATMAQAKAAVHDLDERNPTFAPHRATSDA